MCVHERERDANKTTSSATERISHKTGKTQDTDVYKDQTALTHTHTHTLTASACSDRPQSSRE